MEYTFRTGGESLDEYLGHIRNEFGPTVQEMSRQLPLIVGGVVPGPYVLRGRRPDRGGTPEVLSQSGRRSAGGVDGAAGWFFWSYKLLVEGSDRDGWDLRKSIELGYLPENLGR